MMTVRVFCRQCRKPKLRTETFQAIRHSNYGGRHLATICVGCADRVAGATNPYYGRWDVRSVIDRRIDFIRRNDLSEMVQKGLWK